MTSEGDDEKKVVIRSDLSTFILVSCLAWHLRELFLSGVQLYQLSWIALSAIGSHRISCPKELSSKGEEGVLASE